MTLKNKIVFLALSLFFLYSAIEGLLIGEVAGWSPGFSPGYDILREEDPVEFYLKILVYVLIAYVAFRYLIDKNDED